MSDRIWFWQRIVSPHMAGLAAAMAARGHDVTYVAETPMSAERAVQGWDVPDLGAARLLLAPDAGAMEDLALRVPETSIHLCQGLRGNGAVGAASRALGRRRLRLAVVMETVKDNGWRGPLKRLEYRRLLHLWRHRIDAILAIGHTTPGWLAARGMPADRVFPFAYFLPDTGAPPDARPEGPFRILYVGRLVELKRVDLLIDAVAALPGGPAELAVVGSGPLEGSLRARAEARLPGRARWLGSRPMSEIPAEMARADCVVLPSRGDGWGAVVSEALMAGTPAICSDRCGAAGVVQASGCGGVFASGDTGALASALAATIRRGRQRPSQRAALAAWARCLSADAGAGYLEAILRFMATGGERPAAPWDGTGPESGVRSQGLTGTEGGVHCGHS